MRTAFRKKKREPKRAAAAKSNAGRNSLRAEHRAKSRADKKAKKQAQRDAKFARNFHSETVVVLTRLCACLFCSSRDRVRNAHLLHARGMGGANGTHEDVGPVCFGCDDAWSRGEETFLSERGLTWEDVERLVAAHQVKIGRMLERRGRREAGPPIDAEGNSPTAAWIASPAAARSSADLVGEIYEFDEETGVDWHRRVGT